MYALTPPRYASSPLRFSIQLDSLIVPRGLAWQGLPEQMLSLAMGLTSKVFEHHREKLGDPTWIAAIHQATVQEIRIRQQVPGARPTDVNVLVLGLGTAIPALSAGRAGARVLWVLRVRRFFELAQALVKENALSAQVHVVHRR